MAKRLARGVNKYRKIDEEERIRQWNINMSNRTLETLFGHIETENGTVSNRKFHYVSYTPEQLYAIAEEYFIDIQNKNIDGIAIIPDIEDFCLFSNISRYTFLKYRKSQDPKMADVANAIANAIANCKKSLALHGMIDNTTFAIDFNNNHDYISAKNEVSVYTTSQTAQIEASTNDIINRLPEN